MEKHWRRPHRRKDGTWVRGGWVRGSNPKGGCSFWLFGTVALTGLTAEILEISPS